MKLKTLATLFLLTSFAFADGDPTEVRVTHGPILGRPSDTGMSLWLRTDRAGEVKVLYGTDESNLDQTSEVTMTEVERDLTGIIALNGLKPNTRYYYRVYDHQLRGSFRAMPRGEDFKNPQYNPDGKFNFRFEFACGNNQRGGGDSAGPELVTYDTMNRGIRVDYL